MQNLAGEFEIYSEVRALIEERDQLASALVILLAETNAQLGSVPRTIGLQAAVRTARAALENVKTARI